MRIKVTATIGIGAWTVSKSVKLIACPHAGDRIEIDGVTVTCDFVCIRENDVLVEQTIKFATESAMDEYVEMGWKR